MERVQTSSKRNWNEETLYFMKKDESLYKPHPSTMNIVFYASGLIAVVCMFFGWLSVDVDLGFMQVDGLLENITILSLPGMLKELESSTGILAMLLPSDLGDAIQSFVIVGYIIAAEGIVGGILYGVSVFLRFIRNELGYGMGIAAGLLLLMAAADFIVVTIVLLGLELALECVSVFCYICLAAGIVTMVTARRDYRKNLIILPDGSTAIDMGDKWTCKCGKRNLAALHKCYYCGYSRID